MDRSEMEKDGLPRYSVVDEYPRRRRFRRRIFRFGILAALVYLCFSYWSHDGQFKPNATRNNVHLSTERLGEDYALCKKLRHKPTDPSGPRERNARYIDGHKPYLIRNATVWTGEPDPNTSPEDVRNGKGYAWIQADVFMEYGLIKRVERDIAEADLPADFITYDAHGRQLTSGIVDMHSHTGVYPLPDLRGWNDDNELSNDITPYVRSIDGLNPLDHQIQVIKSGGVTTSLILPGSGNNMGGEAFVIKHAVGKADGRNEISGEDMLADPERTHRYLKMACGENAKRVYGRVGRDFGPFSRMGEAWYFRHAFEQATALVNAQDDWCSTADEIGAEYMGTYLPQDLQWESLGALLRGQVHLNTHCYTAVDLEAFIRHTNEFKFPIRAFHHAHQTYLVPEVLKRAYGGRPPAAALFADSMYYKAESYVASEQAGKILWENGITPVYVSDNPVLNAQHVVFEAAKAYKNGLPYHVALAGVTSASAELLGLGERIGKIKPGFDADIVVWDSDPLSVGASPVQIWIDGTPQFEDPIELEKPVREPLEPKQSLQNIRNELSDRTNLVFTGISKILLPGFEQTVLANDAATVVVTNGMISCVGTCEVEISQAGKDVETINLQNGHFAPALTSFGSGLGLVEIEAEESTQDGFNGDESFSRAVDGLALDTKSLKAAYSHGVTRAISAPSYIFGGHKGVSVGFRTGALHALEEGAVWQQDVSLHYTLTKSVTARSLSGAVSQLRAKLLRAVKANDTEDGHDRSEESYLKSVVNGELPLSITVDSADLIISLLTLKKDVEDEIERHSGSPQNLRLVVIGGAESYMVAESLAEANIGVVLAPVKAFAKGWDQRRSLPGAPLTNFTAIDILHAAGVKVAFSTEEDWETRDLFLLAGIAHANGNGKISEKEALAFVSSNVYSMLGLKRSHDSNPREFVVSEGSPLEIDSQIRAIADGRGKVSLFV